MSRKHRILFAIAAFWLFRLRGYRDKELVVGRVDCVALGVMDWARGYRIAPFWRLVRAQYRYARVVSGKPSRLTRRNVCAFWLALLFGMCTAHMAHAQAVDTLPRVVVRDSTPSLATLRRMDDSLARVEDSLARRLDSLRHPLPYIKAASDAAFRRAMHPGRWYAGALGAGLLVNYACPYGVCDRDPGGYVDSWRTFDKVEHFEIAYFLSDRALDMGVERRWAVALTCGAAIGWEGTQARGGGFASWRDATASCAGAALPVVFDWLRSRRQSGGALRR